MKLAKTLAGLFLVTGLLAHHRVEAAEDDFFGWYTISASGSLEKLSPALKKFRWSAMDQTRLGDASSRLRENLLFLQVGYALTDQVSLALGYTHDWLHPEGGDSFQENRSYQEFLWRGEVGPGTFRARTRLEQRIRDPGGNLNWRIRQMVEYRWPVPSSPRLSVVVFEEPFVYLNSGFWGKSGVSENRAGLSLAYRLSAHTSVEVGYLNQFIYHADRQDSSNHALSVNFSFNY